MASFEWEGLIRVTIGSLSRADQVDLWRIYQESGWEERDQTSPFDRASGLMATDAMVAALATRKIEICKNGKWQLLKDKATIEHDGDLIELSFPPTYEQINQYPRSLGDQWIEVSAERNGGLHNNLSFFSSVLKTNGMKNSESKSDELP